METRFSQCEDCRICGSMALETVLGFENMPVLAEPVKSGSPVASGPLTVLVCRDCGYVFLKEVIDCAIYDEYIYTPQSSGDVVAYLRDFVSNTVEEIGILPGQFGLEIGSGDGSLCREFNAAGMEFTGVEPSGILCVISENQNRVRTCNSFMTVELAERLGKRFDVVVARHVLEHIDSFAPFFEAIDKCLKPDGTLIIEVPFLGDIVSQKQFFAFFFEHLSYFSESSLGNLLVRFGFFINRVKFVHPEGGSLLVHAKRGTSSENREFAASGDTSLVPLKNAFADFRGRFTALLDEYGPVAAYGAGQRGITLLNLLGASSSDVLAIFDENPVYHGLFSPRSNIPVKSPQQMDRQSVPGKVLILASSYDRQIRQKYNCMEDKFVSLSELI